MNFARLKETIRGVLRRNVALGSAEKFVTDHEFLNRSRAQERRKVVRMQVPLFVGARRRWASGGIPWNRGTQSQTNCRNER